MRKLKAFVTSFCLLNTAVFLSTPAFSADRYMLTPNEVCRAIEKLYESEFEDVGYATFATLEKCLEQEGAKLPNSPAGLREKAQALRNKPYDLLDGVSMGTDDSRAEALSGVDSPGPLSNGNLMPLLEDRFELLSNQKAQDIVEANEAVEEAQAQEDFEKFKLGIGIAFTKLHSESIDDVEIRNGQIVVSKERQHRGSFMLETHKFFTFNGLSRLFLRKPLKVATHST